MIIYTFGRKSVLMRIATCVQRSFIIFFAAMLAAKLSCAQFAYQSPQSGSIDNKTESLIIFRTDSEIDRASLNNRNWLQIEGSSSGTHVFSATMARDGRTILISPLQPFAYSEKVNVTVGDQIRTMTGKKITGTSFSFVTEKQPTEEEKRQRLLARRIYDEDVAPASSLKQVIEKDSLPSFKITINNNASKGSFFWNNQNDLYPLWTNCHSVIMSNSGKLSYSKDMGQNGHDFKINYNGYLTWFDYDHNQWIMADSNFNKIDSFKCVNGYEGSTNAHDFVIYPDGHYYLLAYDDQTVDMTPYGGQPNATVTGLIIQKFDADKNLLMQWRSWDHMNITDANNNVSLTGALVDYVHGNSLEEDVDGHLIFSQRSVCEVAKINSETGEYIWRLGGENNQFTFINDPLPLGFNFQHDARLLSNGHLTLFNNGNFLPLQESSAKEYALDVVNKTATLVWSYTHPWVSNGTTPVFGRASGSMQRLNNGNTLIGWGTVITCPTLPNATEVDSLGNIVWEMAFDSLGWKSYRFKKYEWNPCSRPTAYTMSSVVKPGKITLAWEAATNAKSYILRYRPAAGGNWTQVPVQKNKYNILNYQTSTEYVWKVKSVCGNGNSSGYTEERSFTSPAQRLLNEDATEFALNLYPNPASDYLQCFIPGRSDHSVTLTVYNATGTAVANVVVPAGTNEYRFNIAALSSGIYCVKMEYGNSPVMKRFVKE